MYIYIHIYIYIFLYMRCIYRNMGQMAGFSMCAWFSGSRVANTRKVRPITSVSDGTEGGYQELRRSNSLSD